MVKHSLNLWIIPNSKKTQIEGLRETGELIIRLKAPPIEGKANALLIEFLAETLKVSKRSIQIVSGEKSRKKRVEITEPFKLEILPLYKDRDG